MENSVWQLIKNNVVFIKVANVMRVTASECVWVWEALDVWGWGCCWGCQKRNSFYLRQEAGRKQQQKHLKRTHAKRVGAGAGRVSERERARGSVVLRTYWLSEEQAVCWEVKASQKHLIEMQLNSEWERESMRGAEEIRKNWEKRVKTNEGKYRWHCQTDRQ